MVNLSPKLNFTTYNQHGMHVYLTHRPDGKLNNGQFDQVPIELPISKVMELPAKHFYQHFLLNKS